MRDLLLQRTDAAVLAQALAAGVVFAKALLLARRNCELVLLVIGFATVTCGLFGLRALH